MNHRAKYKRSGGLAGTLPGLIQEKNWERKFDQHRVFPDWQKLVDKDMAAHARPLKVVKDVLWLEVDNSAWMQQLQFQKIWLLETLNAYLKVSRFSDIRFAVREREPEHKKPEEKRVRFVSPPPAEVEAFERQISFIEDEAVRDSLMRLWYLSRACQRDQD